MRLNPDLVRDILLTAEETIDPNRTMMFGERCECKYERLEKYSAAEISYHINQCYLSGFITKVNYLSYGLGMVEDLSPEGHSFLADIRADNNWNKTKSIAKNVGSCSLDAIKQIAADVIAKLISGNSANV